MANQKISAMTPATAFSHTDVFAGLQSGSNVKITRDIFLAMLAGEHITVGNTHAFWQCFDDGTVILSNDGSNAFLIAIGADSVLLYDGVSDVSVSATSGGTLSLLGGGSSILFDGSGGAKWIYTPGQTITIGYAVSTPGNWVGGAAGDVWNALDRLAAAVASLLGGPVP